MHREPAIVTSRAFTDVLLDAEIAISMDGRGRALDNVFIERLWRSVKYENIYLRGYDSVLALSKGLAAYFEFYNHERRHMSLDYATPWEEYSAGRERRGKKAKPFRAKTSGRAAGL